MEHRMQVLWQKPVRQDLLSLLEMIQVNLPIFVMALEGEKEPQETYYDPSRCQYDAAGLLKELSEEDICLYLVHVDLYYPGYCYLYGAAALNRAVVSDFRPDTVAGLAKEVCHELGHALGLSHCSKNCIMHVARSGWELERKNQKFCSDCDRKLGRLISLKR